MRTTVMNALIHPVHLIVLAIAVISGLIAAWWLFPLGILVWLGMVLRYVFDPAEKFQQKMEGRESLTSRFQDPFHLIQRVQVQMFNSVSSAPPAIRKELQPVLDKVDALVEVVYQLCKSMTPIENYQKVSGPISNLTEQLKLLNLQISQASDPVAKKNYEEARDSLSIRIDQQNKTVAKLNQLDAYLAELINELNTTLGQVISLQSLKADAIRQKVPEVTSRIQNQMEEAKKFSQEELNK